MQLYVADIYNISIRGICILYNFILIMHLYPDLYELNHK